jgi:hypothetical protein
MTLTITIDGTQFKPGRDDQGWRQDRVGEQESVPPHGHVEAFVRLRQHRLRRVVAVRRIGARGVSVRLPISSDDEGNHTREVRSKIRSFRILSVTCYGSTSLARASDSERAAGAERGEGVPESDGVRGSGGRSRVDGASERSERAAGAERGEGVPESDGVRGPGGRSPPDIKGTADRPPMDRKSREPSDRSGADTPSTDRGGARGD